MPVQVVRSTWRHDSQRECERYRESLSLSRAVVPNPAANDSHLRRSAKNSNTRTPLSRDSDSVVHAGLRHLYF